MKKNFEGWKYTFGAVLGGVFIGLRTSPCAMRAQGWDGMWSQGVAGAAFERPQRGERCIARRAIAARGEASPRASKKREMGKGLK